MSQPHPHMIDLIRRKRDGGQLTEAEIRFLVAGAADGSLPVEQLAAWLMAARLNGLVVDEIRALTVAMRDSGERYDPHRSNDLANSSGSSQMNGPALDKLAVDKHSTGGVGDKTSFLVAPLAAACGVAVPMISGRALGHTGGTLDKLESIPGYQTALTLEQLDGVVRTVGASIVSQTPKLVPADRVLYALRDRTGTVESPGLICASILSKKLAAGLDALVLDVKTGSGAFLTNPADAEYLAALMVATAEAAGTRTVALMTEMGQPLGEAAGNWIELVECVRLLRGERWAGAEDVRELSLTLAGWMIHLGDKAATPAEGYALAEAALTSGRGELIFLAMVAAQGGDLTVFGNLALHHAPGATRVVAADRAGWVDALDTTALGWAVQRTGAGREQAGAAVDAHAGIVFHAKRGARVEVGDRLATIYATDATRLDEPEALLRAAITWAEAAPEPRPLVGRVFTRAEAEGHLATIRR